MKLLATWVSAGEGLAKERQALGAFAEQAQAGGKRVRIERRHRRLVGFDASPVGVADRLAHGQMIAGGGRTV
jgi:hypothetical protein